MTDSVFNIEKLVIKNYRCFDNLEVTLHPKLTVLVAENGGGKTTILDAARIALWPFVKGFDLGSQTGKKASIEIDDVRLVTLSNGEIEPQVPSVIETSGKWGNFSSNKWRQTRERVKSGTNTLFDIDSKNLTKYAENLQKDVRGGKEITLPLVSYLGTSRVLNEGRLTSETTGVALNNAEFSRTSGYLNCLSYPSSFKTFVAWYVWVCKSADEIRRKKKEDVANKFSNVIQIINAALDEAVKKSTGWHNLEYSESQNQQLVMQHETFGSIPVERFSDGLRNTITLIADLAFRICKLNPHLGIDAAKKTPGVVLIDEVDMFLHPKWQQTILTSLQKAFPMIQFIVTTHSPQVLSTVKKENIRIIEGNYALEPMADSYGFPNNSVMQNIMNTNPLPPILERISLEHLTELIDQGKYDEKKAIELMKELVGTLGANHDDLLRLQRSIERQKSWKELELSEKEVSQ